MARVKDRAAVVTEGGLGMGFATGRLLAREGAVVVDADRDAVNGKAAVERASGLMKEKS
jgi:NAD(P)-dependent dehydrogenase (short-subunit alcohol dehydrogenase family)